MTPLEVFGSMYLKREDKNLTGSAKDRAIEVQIKNLIDKDYTSATISSTGNAAISAHHFCHQAKVPLTIFFSPNINPHKKSIIEKLSRSTNTNIIESISPISDAFKFSKKNHSYFLRQSTDPVAQQGYSQIGTELLKQIPQITSLFIPVGSGTTLLGIASVMPKSVKIFAVQPAAYCPIASFFDKNYIPETYTITDALGAKFLPLKQQVINTCYSGIVVQNKDITHHFPSAPESMLAIAGYNKVKDKQPVGKYPVILITAVNR